MKEKLLSISFNLILLGCLGTVVLGTTGIASVNNIKGQDLSVIAGIGFVLASVAVLSYNYKLMDKLISFLPKFKTEAKLFVTKKFKNKDVYFPLSIGFLSGAIVYFRWVNAIGRISMVFGLSIFFLVFFFSCLIMTDK